MILFLCCRCLTSHSRRRTCSACGKVMQGAFVRALGAVYHLNCFKCMVNRHYTLPVAFSQTSFIGLRYCCGFKVLPHRRPGWQATSSVRARLLPASQPDLCEVWTGVAWKLYNCMQYVCTPFHVGICSSLYAGKKFHVEHFTCSVCPTLFGPQDSYYEHDGDVYCHYHYSTRFATKCAGCNSAILKQFVEINRNMRDECWHPECYMINKVCSSLESLSVPTDMASLVLEREGRHTTTDK